MSAKTGRRGEIYSSGSAKQQNSSHQPETDSEWGLSIQDARPILPRASFFLGDLRDGLPMLNMQAAYLISDKDFSEKQVGLLFLAFGLSQFLCMTPAGYFLDYSNHKIEWVVYSAILVSAITVVGTLTAEPQGKNIEYLLLWRVIQGGLTAIIPPGFNSITLGIVGTKGFTHQVSRNRMMNHMGTAMVVASGSLIAYFYYPNLGFLFSVSPIAAAGVHYYLMQIKPDHVHRDAARALILESPTMEEYELADDLAEAKKQAINILQWESNQSSDSDWSSSNCQDNQDNRYHPTPRGVHGATSSQYNPPCGLDPPAISPLGAPLPPTLSPALVDPRATQRNENPTGTQRNNPEILLKESGSHDPPSDNSLSMPSFNLGCRQPNHKNEDSKPRTPWDVLMNATLWNFTVIVFLFHLANSSVLPLVMQSLALNNGQAGILLSGLCILIGQGFMVFFAKICGDFSPYWGRKSLILVGLISLTIRCFLLSLLESAKDNVETERGGHILRIMVLSTQLLDSVGAGIMGTMHILVTADISGGTGRFSLLLGLTTAAMCLGATISGYLGQALAQDYGYPFAFTALGAISLAPFALYTFCMPETLPEHARPRSERRKRLKELLKRLNEHKRNFIEASTKPFRRRLKATSSSSSIDPTPIASAELV